MNILFLLFVEFFKIALFTVGGGLVMIPVIENTFVKKHKLLKEADIMDMVGITQTVPGLIAVNSAVFVGHKLAGWRGSFVATLGVILPSMLIIMAIAALFPLENISGPHTLRAFQCIRACVLGLFLILAYRMAKKLIKSIEDIFFFIVLLGLLISNISSVLIVISACTLGGLYETYARREKKK